MPLISQNEYAQQRGVSREAVRRHVAAGRITMVDGKIDPVIADAQWAANVRNPRAPFLRRSHGPAVESPAPPADCAISQSSYDLQLSRAKREHHEAALAEMRERKMAGDLVELAQVHLAYTTLAAQLRSALERIPDKIAPRLAAETNERVVYDLLMTELDQALLDMVKTAEQLPEKLQDAARHD